MIILNFQWFILMVFLFTQKKKLDQHFNHLKTFFSATKRNGLAVSAPKLKLFHTKIQLGNDIFNSTSKPIQRSIEFADKCPDEMKDKNQFQRFLGWA